MNSVNFIVYVLSLIAEPFSVVVPEADKKMNYDSNSKNISQPKPDLHEKNRNHFFLFLLIPLNLRILWKQVIHSNK